MLPPLTDFVALLGIVLVLCAGCLYLLKLKRGLANATRAQVRWLVAACFVVLWLPAGSAHLPIAATIRGFTSDLSISLVGLACLYLCHGLSGLSGFRELAKRERSALFIAVAASALFLYPIALGWGDWDAYRPGWGSAGMWAGLLLVSAACWVAGLRLLPMLIALALLSWTFHLMESTNLWDYLLDPWLAIGALFYCAKAGATQLRAWFRRTRPGINAPSSST